MDICRSRFALRRLRGELSSALHPAHGKTLKPVRREKKRVWDVRANETSQRYPTVGSASPDGIACLLFISRLMAVKGGSPGNAQRLTSERGAPVRRR